ncbi:hypothetical protein ICN20_10155, partial [Polynucleobacter sp. JS-Polo-80-F4]|nr:hypothetical protein [Polynucleobacter sp. JS-Polo-80-F4]
SKNQLAQTVTIEENALIDTSSTSAGNGGAIAIWSEVKTTVAGILKSMGGSLSGNGGFIETSSKGIVSLAPTASINTSANNATGNAGTWLLDPVNLIIDASTANAISTALFNSNVTIAVTANTTACSVGSCVVNGTGSMTIISGAHILKAGTSYTTLTLSAAGDFLLNGSIEGQNLDVVISSSIAYLGVGSSINASKVTVQAQTIIVANNARVLTNNYLLGGGAGTLGNAIELLAQSIFISGALRLGAGLPTVPAAPLTVVNLVTLNADQSLNKIYSTTAANDPSLLAVTSATQAASNVIYLTASQIDPTSAAIVGIEGTAQVLANGTTGGSIYLRGTDIYTRSGSLLQANGTAGAGGMIGMKADAITIAGEIAAGGSSNGGSINLIADSGLLDLQTTLITANGGTGAGGNINAQVAGANLLMANTAMSVGMPSSGIDISSILFLRLSVSSAAAGSLNLAYEIIDASGTAVTLGSGAYANLSISGTPAYFSSTSAITNSAGVGSYSNLIVKGLALSGADSAHFMLVLIPGALTVTAAQPAAQPAATVRQSVLAAVLPPPPPPPPPPAMFSAPLPAPAPAKLEVSSTLASMVAPAPPVPANAPPPAAGGEVAMQAPVKAAPLMMMADGSIQLTPPPPPGAAPPPANAPSTQAPPPAAPPPTANRASSNKESRDAKNGSTNSETRKYASTKDGVEKADAKDRSGKSSNGPSKYVSKYANGFSKGDKPAPKEGLTKTAAVNKPPVARVGKYDNRINAMNNNPGALAPMNQNPFSGNISPFPVGVPHVDVTPLVLRGGDSLAQSYDDVPSIRNSGVANAARSRNSENFHQSLESVNLMSTLNLFIIH